jgi:tetratricopeptide (TPR) repeat protein
VVDRLKADRWVRIEDVLEAKSVRKSRVEMFEAEAWLLVHWYLADEERKGAIGELLDPLARPDPAAPLNPASMPRGWLTDQLENYLAAGVFPTVAIDLQGRVDASTTTITAVPEVEAEYRMGQLLTAQRQAEQAQIMFAHAMQLDPDSWMPYDGKGILATANFQFGDARRAYADAVARAPTVAGPYYDHARTILARPHGAKGRAKAREALTKVTTLDPSFLEAYAQLADLAYREKDLPESVRWAGRGLQIDPRDSRLRALLGRAQFASGDLQHARLNTQIALQECRDARACSDAAALLKVVIERMPAASPTD